MYAAKNDLALQSFTNLCSADQVTTTTRVFLHSLELPIEWQKGGYRDALPSIRSQVMLLDVLASVKTNRCPTQNARELRLLAPVHG